MTTIPNGMQNPADQQIQSKATHAIIAAVVGFFCCFLVDIYAIIVANQALTMINQSGAGQQHRTLAMVAKVIAIIHLCLAVLGILLWFVMMIFGIVAGVANQ